MLPERLRYRRQPGRFLAVGSIAVDSFCRMRRHTSYPDSPGIITSASTRNEDIAKRSLYERLGVAEYFLLVPSGDYLAPESWGFWLVTITAIVIGLLVGLYFRRRGWV